MDFWLVYALVAFLLVAFCGSSILAEAPEKEADLPSQIRGDHPRLFFNRETWPAVRERAIGPAKAWYERYRGQVDRLIAGKGRHRSNDHGVFAAKAAFCYLVSDDAKYRQAAGAE